MGITWGQKGDNDKDFVLFHCAENTFKNNLKDCYLSNFKEFAVRVNPETMNLKKTCIDS